MIVGPLIPFDAPAFAPLCDLLARAGRVLLVPAVSLDGTVVGNAGDRMIELAAEQFLDHIGVSFVGGTPQEAVELGCDTIALFGGGSFGHPYCRPEAEVRRAAIDTGLPCVLLPQTAYGTEWGWQHHSVFVRDGRSSLWWHPAGRCVPDLALGLSLDIGKVARKSRGNRRYHSILLEGRWAGVANDGDPRTWITDPREYGRFAAEHSSITTDIVHLAIGALMAGVPVTLLPTRLHKQRSLWETWLGDLGCEWSDRPEVSFRDLNRLSCEDVVVRVPGRAASFP